MQSRAIFMEQVQVGIQPRCRLCYAMLTMQSFQAPDSEHITGRHRLDGLSESYLRDLSEGHRFVA